MQLTKLIKFIKELYGSKGILSDTTSNFHITPIHVKSTDFSRGIQDAGLFIFIVRFKHPFCKNIKNAVFVSFCLLIINLKNQLTTQLIAK